MNIIMFNMSSFRDWQDGIVNRNFFICHNLAKDPRVKRIIAVDLVPFRGPRPFNFKRVVRYGYRNFIADGRYRLPGSLVKVIRQSDKIWSYSSLLLYFSPRHFWEDINFKAGSIFEKSEPLVVWLYNPFLVESYLKIPARLKVFDMVDNWLEHPSYVDARNLLKDKYFGISSNADVIFTVARESLEFYKRQKVFWIPNGVDLENFEKSDQAPPDLSSIKRPIIGYVGTIQERIDFELLRFLALRNPEKSLIMVGPIWKSVKAEVDDLIMKFSNIHFLGRRPNQEIAGYMKNFDVAVIPHRESQFLKSTNPMKMYEYLAAGRPIVSTPGAGMDMFPGLVSVAGNFQDFHDQINEALVKDSAERISQRRQAVKNHSWSARVRQMLEIISRSI